MNTPSRRADLYALLLLTALWALFFWRAFAPPPDAVSVVEGDFSAQFYAFSAYQAERLRAGEVPLWNPYNNAGHPFLADTQTAVFYPPRLLAIYASSIFGGWGYGVLQLEAVAHYWLAAALMYAFVRRVTGRPFAGVVAALAFAYGGFLTGYPLQQLAILEAVTWLPLILLGIFQATQQRGKVGWACMVLAGVALGLCLMAGHPQTALFCIYIALAYLAYRLPLTSRTLRRFVLAAAVMGIFGAGLAAVQLVPGWEYLQHTTRAGMGFEAKAGGFPLQDVLQFFIPSLVSYWSPLYVGLVGLALAGLAVGAKVQEATFWAIAALAALLYSFGGHTVVYDIAYNLLPGARLFRGQERAASMVAFSLAVLAGLGARRITEGAFAERFARRFLWALAGIAALISLIAGIIFFRWFGSPDWVPEIAPLGAAAFALAAAVFTLALLAWRFRGDEPPQYWPAALIALVVFELFSANMGQSFEPASTGKREFVPQALVQPILQAQGNEPFRVDGLGGNYGTLYGLADTGGISPLRLTSHDEMLRLPAPLQWRLLGVRYVFSTADTLPAQSDMVATEGDIYLHRLHDTHPMAWLDDAAPGDWPEPFAPLEGGEVTFIAYAPEHLAVEYDAPEDAYLFFAEHDYPGWRAALDGETVDIITAWGHLRAVRAPAGRHTVEMRYRPASFTLGALVSAVTLLATAAVALWPWLRQRQRRRV